MERSRAGRQTQFVAVRAGEKVIAVGALGHISFDRQMVAGQTRLSVRVAYRIIKPALIGVDASAIAEVIEVAHNPLTGTDAQQVDAAIGKGTLDQRSMKAPENRVREGARQAAA